MKIAGWVLIGFGLLLFGNIDIIIPIACIIGGLGALKLDRDYKF